ncbi:MAG: acyl-CoA synthetase FdrA [Anaerolineae bacterium]|nr:acyl-CoA synthetase FdrA [Anaerolineae bacterium]
MKTISEIRPGAYFDSVVLMQLQRSLAELHGVDDAGVVMATPANLELLADAELLTKEGKEAQPDDLLIVVRAEKEKDAAAAIEQVDDLLQKRRSRTSHEFRPHSLEAAAKQLPEADWVLISVPGRYAAGVAQEALDLGKHVFLYSDNVSLEDEIELKTVGLERGLLVMGPDCGTAIVNGVGLGFANRLRRGNIGLVGASGTGLQAITTQIHNSGGGVSQAIGTGGRDLKAKVGGMTAMQALDLLSRDDETDVIVLVSKPPDSTVATRLIGQAMACGKPVVVDFIGYPPPAHQIGNLHFATGLSEAGDLAVRLSNRDKGTKSKDGSGRSGYVRGLFSGGTLAYEAMLALQPFLTPLYSNVPISEHQLIDDPLNSEKHSILDLGEDIFTVGRLHPMMDNDLRLRRMRQEAADQETSMILFDVVLGEGSHADPTAELAEEINSIKKDRDDIIWGAIVVGTDEDPQGTQKQIERLSESGVEVYRSTQSAATFIAENFTNDEYFSGKPVEIEGLYKPLAAINVGLESFHDSLKEQGAESVHVEWRPPAGGNEDLMDILAKMRS